MKHNTTYTLDLYSRIILTVIAIALAVLCLRPVAAPRSAAAFEQYANAAAPAQVDLNLQQIGGRDIQPGQPLRVEIVNWPDSLGQRYETRKPANP